MHRFRIHKAASGALALLMALVCSTGAMQAENATKQTAVPPPPMGWSSWNSFSNTVDAQITMDQAKAMVSRGIAKAGYQYVNIDEGWWLGERDAEGNILVDPKAWPALAAGERAGDMSNIVRFLHGLGLKAGIYTDAGKDGCSLYPDLGPAPAPPGFNALVPLPIGSFCTQIAKGGRRSVPLHRSRPLSRRSGCFPAWPYPPLSSKQILLRGKEAAALVWMVSKSSTIYLGESGLAEESPSPQGGTQYAE